MSMLSPEQWERVFSLFHEALEQPPEERRSWLATACEGTVRAEVERLLDADDAPPDVMEDGAAPLAGMLFEPEEDPDSEGTLARVGPYRLVREIGRGGMSAVYLAERDDGAFEHRVALKVLHRFFGREGRADRFRAERQILASLDHPNIAQLHDGGVLPDGRPYLVMEYVDGQPIDAYCSEHNLSLEARIDLLTDVCGAIQHAHQQLIVHRDVKPSNILVTPDGIVKLLDFGISKLLDADDSRGQVPVTQPGERWMTPEYAAPEQVEGKAVSTATDVYQIGILAYELLSGRRPFTFDTSAGLSDIEETVRTTTPSAPSSVAESEAWRRSLMGDLDTIVLKALRKDPEQRYATPQDLAHDLDRYQAQRPIEARPPTWRYRSRKFLQRNRTLVGAAVLVFLVVTGAAAALLYQTQRIAAERNRATAAAQQAERVSTFLTDLVAGTSPDATRGDTLTAGELLERSLTRLDRLDQDPTVQANMLAVVGRVYRRLGRYDRADSLFRRALQLQAEHGDTTATARLQQELGLTHYRQGRYNEADSLFHHVLDVQQRRHDAPHPDLAAAWHHWARGQQELGHRARADSAFAKALSLGEAVYADHDPDLARTLHAYGFLKMRRGDYTEAERLMKNALAIQRDTLGTLHLTTATTLNDLALLYKQQGALEKAVPLYQEALSVQRTLVGKEHPDVATTLNNLAITLLDLERTDEAQSMMEEALAIRKQVLGPNHPRVATTYHSLSMVARAAEDYEQALAYERSTLRILKESYGPTHPRVHITTASLGWTYVLQGRYDQGAPLLRDAQDALSDQLGPRHPFVGIAVYRRARLAQKREAWAQAVEKYRTALDVLADYPNRVAAMQWRLGTCLMELGKRDEARTALETSLSWYRQAGEKEKRQKAIEDALRTLD